MGKFVFTNVICQVLRTRRIIILRRQSLKNVYSTLPRVFTATLRETQSTSWDFRRANLF